MRRIQHVMSVNAARGVFHSTTEHVQVVDGELRHLIVDSANTQSERIVSAHPAVIQYIETADAIRSRVAGPIMLPSACADCDNTGWVVDAEGNGRDCVRCAG